MFKPVKISKETISKDKDLIAVAAKLQSAPLVKMDLKKTVYNAITEDEKSYEGSLRVSRGKLKLEISRPEKTMVLVKKSEIWVVNYDLEDDGKVSQVLHLKSGKDKSHKLLLSILDGDELLKEFSLKNSSRKGDDLTFELTPKNKIEMVEKILLVVSDENKKIRSISYWDEQENKTKFDFIKTEFLKNPEDESFRFSPPKGVKIEEL